MFKQNANIWFITKQLQINEITSNLNNWAWFIEFSYFSSQNLKQHFFIEIGKRKITITKKKSEKKILERHFFIVFFDFRRVVQFWTEKKMDETGLADSAAGLAEREARINERRERIRQREYAKNHPEQVELVEGEFFLI